MNNKMSATGVLAYLIYILEMIGLFTAFEILAKYGASFTLDEAPKISGDFGLNYNPEIKYNINRKPARRFCTPEKAPRQK